MKSESPISFWQFDTTHWLEQLKSNLNGLTQKEATQILNNLQTSKEFVPPLKKILFFSVVNSKVH